MTLLDRIDSPQDLHGLTEDELEQVAQEIRELLIDTVGEIGGHFGANLGTCEIAVALHSLLDSPTDKILWDVGHQAYPHKILTGRRDALGTIRKYGGLAPFCAIHESEHDIMGAGHASTSIGYGVGIKEAMRRGDGADGKVVAVIGDGAMTGGVAFEAIHQAGGLGTPLVVILNDNGMSIAPNVGALSRYFNRVRLEPGLWKAREGVEEKLTRLPAGIGARFERLGPQLKESIKALWASGPVLGGARLGLHGRHRRPRRPHPPPRAARRLRGRAAGRHPLRDGQGQGLLARGGRRPRGHGEVARGEAELDREADAGAVEAGRRRAEAAAVHQGVRRGARGRVQARSPRRRHHRGDELRHRAEHPPERDAGPLLRRRDRRAAGAAVRGRPRAPGLAPGRRDLLDLPAARLRPDRPRPLPPAAPGRPGDGPRRARRRRRPDPPRRVRHRLPALPAEHHADGAARRGDARPHAPHGAAARRRAGRDPLPPRRGGRRAAAGRAVGAPDRHRRDPARGRARGDRRLRLRRRAGARRRRSAGRGRARRHRRGRALRQAARHRAARPARRRARAARHRRGGRALRRVRHRRLGGAVGGRADAADPPRRAARPLRHPRRAEAAARRGRLHARAHRRADPVRRARPPRVLASA